MLNKIKKTTDKFIEVQDATEGGKFIVKKVFPQKDVEKDQKIVDQKIGEKFKVTQTMVNKAFDDSLKNKKNTLNNRILKAVGLDRESMLNYAAIFTGVAAVSSLFTKGLPLIPAGALKLAAATSLAIAPVVRAVTPAVNMGLKSVGLTATTWEITDIINEYNNLPRINGEYFIDKDGEKHFSPSSYVSKQLNKHKNQNPYDKLRNSGKKYFDEYNTGVIQQEIDLREKHGITDTKVNVFKLEHALNNMTAEELLKYQNFTPPLDSLGDVAGELNQNLESYIETGVLNNEKGIEIEGTNYEGVPILDLEPLEIIKASPIPEPKFTDPELASGEIQGKFGNMNTQTNTTKKKKTNKPSFWNRFSSNQYVNISREELRAKYKAHRAREIQNDPSMEYFYSSKYQDEHQNMFGTISCSNINPSEAHNFSSPVGGSFTSPFSSLSNEIAPFKIPPFLTIVYFTFGTMGMSLATPMYVLSTSISIMLRCYHNITMS